MNGQEIVRLIKWLRSKDLSDTDIIDCIEFIVKNSAPDKEEKK